MLAAPDAPAGEDVLALPRCGSDGTDLDAPELSNALVRRVQRWLVAHGFDPGPIDGLIGPRTRAAIRAFERAQGQPARGAIDFVLLERLSTPPR
ncbi:hypothetical protein HF203_05985 [Marichromatium bheemlicum]|uniref:Peptidoglycan binding-like domain-containing protein n=1 Tax=Marichromatium bheemlicum TaxID=365339 RepID=A0ABX1I5B7_9GAMM|nr:hypothetical protein [Marichromatium bheemlicum]